jgi:hypothetical protein
VSGLGEKFRLDSFLRTVIRELRVEGVVPRLSAVGADLDGAEVDEVENDRGYMSESGVKWMGGSAKRQRDRTLPRQAAGGVRGEKGKAPGSAVQAGSAPGGGACGGRFRETLARKQRLANPAAPRAEMGDTVRARRGV